MLLNMPDLTPILTATAACDSKAAELDVSDFESFWLSE